MSRKNHKSSQPQTQPTAPTIPQAIPDLYKTDIAIGTMATGIVILFLYLINSIIASVYQPDVKTILDKVIPLTFYPESWFSPEPTERLQYIISLLSLPFLAILGLWLANKLRTTFTNSPSIATTVNIIGLIAFLVFIVKLMGTTLPHVDPEADTTHFFKDTLIGSFTGASVIMVAVYMLMAYGMVRLVPKTEKTNVKNIIRIAAFIITGLTIADVFLYDILNLAVTDIGNLGEINAVFYSITQVCTGKALLVDFNAQYGLYAWFLAPVFKIIGLSTYNFGLVMATLNSAAFLFLYLGIRKLVQRDIMSLLIFLSVVFWQFWITRVPSDTVPPEAVPRMYYQYWPIRLIFPSLIFYLVTLYNKGIQRNLVRILLSLCSASAILWNMDTGLVAFGAVGIYFILSAFHERPTKEAIKLSALNIGWLAGGAVVVVGLFCITTKIHTGVWPDFGKALTYQGIYYVSGYYMLPMAALHFWNVPVLLYLIGAIYCVRNFRSTIVDVPVLSFLIVLGAGLFSYFQGRSYDTNICIVMYPAVILTGLLCDKALSAVNNSGKLLHERTLAFSILFIFIADGALSMLYHTPAVHSFGIANVKATDAAREKYLSGRMDVLRNNIKPHDTVLILSRNFESYCYASGQYVNPMNQAGSTEWFFKTDLDTIVSFVKHCRYPIIYDGNFQIPTWYLHDTLFQMLADYTVIDKISPDGTFVLLRPTGHFAQRRLKKDSTTAYYSNLGILRNFSIMRTSGPFNTNFDLDFIVRLDSILPLQKKQNILFTNGSPKIPFCGVLMQQYGDDMQQYKFEYGNGREWTATAYCRLEKGRDVHLRIAVRSTAVSMYVDDKICGQSIGAGMPVNSDGAFQIDPGFPGVVKEFRIENY